MDIGKVLLPSLALILGIVTGIYFLIWWHAHKDGRHARSLLFWSISLFLIFWFQIPAILISFGKVITVTDFNLFFTLTFPFTFVALVLVYLGFLQIAEFSMAKRKKIFFFSWFTAAVIFFAYSFIINKGVINTYALPIVGNFAFYVPIRALIIFIFMRWLFRTEAKSAVGVFGAIAIITESVLGLMRNFFVIIQVLSWPPQFWYTAIEDSRFFFVTQTLSVILLVIGFYLLHRFYHRLRFGNNPVAT